MEATARKESQEKPKSYKFSLKTPYLEKGRITHLLAETENLWIHTKINAAGGENAIHAHLDEDHSFIVLEGEMTVFDEKGNELVVKQYEGVMIPRGAYYRYLNTGKGNLMVIRVGGGAQKQGGEEMRIRPDGKPLPSLSEENHHVEPVVIPGKFFGESAG
jgi:mannose-6-phosphate isomerase-like protein (cupin superfamily)